MKQGHELSAHLAASAKATALLAFVVSVTGCATSLSVQPLSDIPSPGMIYFLPKISYRVEHVRELESCGPWSLYYVEWLAQELDRIHDLADPTANALLDFAEGKDSLCNDETCRNATASLKAAVLCRDEAGKQASKKANEEACEKKQRRVWIEWMQGVLREAANDAEANSDFVADKEVAGVVAILGKWRDRFTSMVSGAGKTDQLGPLVDELKDELSLGKKVLSRIHTSLELTLSTTNGLDRLRVKHSAVVKSQITADPKRAYVLDYQKLSERTKKTTFGAEFYPNGTLKSINATIDDQTGEIIGSAVRSAIAIASIAGGFPAVLGALPATDGATAEAAPFQGIRGFQSFDEFLALKSLCAKEVLAALALRERLQPLQKKLATAKESVAKAEKCLKDSTAAGIAAQAEETAILELLKKVTLGDKPATDALVQRLVASRTTLSAEQEKRTKCQDDKKKADEALAKMLTDNRADIEILAKLDLKLKSSSLTLFVPEVESRQKELNGALPAADLWLRKPDPASLPVELSAYVAIHQQQGPCAWKSSPVATMAGVVFRQPADAEILVCKVHPCLSPNSVDLTPGIEKSDLILSEATKVPQLGAIGSLPLTNKTFQNNTLIAGFGVNGELISFSYTDNARAKRAAEAIESSVETLRAYSAAKQDAKKAALTREVEELEAEKQRLIKLKEIEEARKALEALNPQPAVNPNGN